MAILALDRPAQPLDRIIAMAEHRWPEVSSALAPHRCQLLVTTGGPSTTAHEAFRDASFVSVAAAALTMLAPARAVYFPSSESLLTPDVFRQFTSGLARNTLPLQIWLQLIPL